MAENSTSSELPEPDLYTHNITSSTEDIVVRQMPNFTTTSSPLDNGDVATGLITAETARMVETVVQAGILPVLVAWGVTTNMLNMAVFWRQGLNDRINIGLFSLALSDSGYLLLLFSSRVYSLVRLSNAAWGQFWKSRSLVLVGLYTAFLNVSNLLTLLISLDRAFCVALPLKAKGVISARSTARVVAAIFLFCLTCCGLACFKYDVIAYVNPADNVTHYRSTLTPFYRRHRTAIDGVYQYGMNVGVPTLSLLGVMVATSVIAVCMRRSISWRRQMATKQTTGGRKGERREMAITRMLVVVCLIFTFCTLPTVTLTFVRTLTPGFLPSGPYTHAFYVTNCLMHLLSSINCSSNFLIYYLMGSRFRFTLRQMMTVGCCRHKDEATKRNGHSMNGSASEGSVATVKLSESGLM